LGDRLTTTPPGTYLGDYFGILMSSRITGFPFNILSDPMYVGSTLAFLGGAILYESPAGIAISALVWIVYVIALRFEGYVYPPCRTLQEVNLM
jgi:methylene-fatty-acyl-phospholipid synthase